MERACDGDGKQQQEFWVTTESLADAPRHVFLVLLFSVIVFVAAAWVGFAAKRVPINRRRPTGNFIHETFSGRPYESLAYFLNLSVAGATLAKSLDAVMPRGNVSRTSRQPGNSLRSIKDSPHMQISMNSVRPWRTAGYLVPMITKTICIFPHCQTENMTGSFDFRD